MNSPVRADLGTFLSCSGSVTEALDNLRDDVRVTIKPLKEKLPPGKDEHGSVIATYKDGTALLGEAPVLPNSPGNGDRISTYYLHRNGESVFYELRDSAE